MLIYLDRLGSEQPRDQPKKYPNSKFLLITIPMLFSSGAIGILLINLNASEFFPLHNP